MKIVYPNPDGTISVIHPNPSFETAVGIMAIALKDVPKGSPFRIMNAIDIPANPTTANISMATPDGIGADYGVGSIRLVVGWNGTTPIVQ